MLKYLMSSKNLSSHNIFSRNVSAYERRSDSFIKWMATLCLSFCGGLAQAQKPSAFDCLIEPWEVVAVGFADQGVISALNVEVSQSVKKGETLAALESGPEAASVNLRRYRAKLTQEISAAQSSQAFAQRNLKRIQDLYQKNAVPYFKLDEVETDAAVAANRLQQAKDSKTVAELELRMAEEMLSRRTIKSPIDGVVVKRHKSVGEFLKDEPVLTVAQTNPLRVQVLMPVALFGKIEKGMEAKVVPEAPLSQREKRAKVAIVDQNIDVASGTFAVQLELDNTVNKIPSGLKCSVQFDNLKASP